jgi:hypothetical protein
LQHVSVLEGHPQVTVHVQEEDGHNNLFSLRTGQNSIHELAEEEEEEEEEGEGEEEYMQKGTEEIISRRTSRFRYFS